MSINNPAPTFLQPATVTFNATSGPVALGIPWVVSFDNVGPLDQLCVLTQPARSSDPGLWALVQTNEDASLGQRFKWKLALGFRDVCNVIAIGATLEVIIDATGSQSYPPGYSVWKNGTPQSNAEVFVEPGAIWVVTHVPSSGGGGGGDVSLTATYMPSDMPTPQPTDPEVALNENGLEVSHLNLQTLKSIGGVTLGALVIGVNR